jgi:hypothetical protein
MLSLKDLHKGETAWIIGKGTSLLNLKREHIGTGIIIAIYEAVIPIEHLDFPNITYSLQKDGGKMKKKVHELDYECDHRGECNYCEWVVRPRYATLLMHEDEAKWCFEDYSPRYLFTLKDIGMDENQFSLCCAIRIAQFMGCTDVKLVSFDAHVTGDNRNVVPIFDQRYYDWIYEEQRKILPKYLEGVKYEWVTPLS